MKLLHIDGKFYEFLDTFWNLLKLNFMWLLFSLPLVTIGCATVAAYDVALRLVEQREGNVVAQFRKAFKDNWKQGLPMGLITLFIAYSIYLNLQLFDKAEGNPLIFLLFAILLGAVGLSHVTYAFPLCARYENSVYRTFRNSAAITVKYFLRTLSLWLVLCVLVFVFLFNSTLLFIGILIGPAAVFFTVSSFAVKVFREIGKE